MMRHVLSALMLTTIVGCGDSVPDFSEASVADLHDQLQRGEVTSADLVRYYSDRIEAIDRSGPTLNAIIEINPDALSIAQALDAEWQDAGPRGPLHGIPIILKANIDTADKMFTSAGSLALADHLPSSDAFLVKRLRDAGAVILGKANLSEWANFRSSRSSSGWSSVAGQTLNPYDTTRTPCGSSSGSAVAVAANLTMVAIGTETDGSIVCPSGVNGVVGIKPTLGLISRSGIIPIAHSQDTAGPIARSVRDAAIVLTALTGIDSDDDATLGAEIHHDYASNLTADALRDKRIGIIRSFHGAGSNPNVEAIFTTSIQHLEAGGAIIVDDLMLDTDGLSTAEYDVLLYEFHADLNRYLENSQAPVSDLASLIAYNQVNEVNVMPIFGQDILELAVQKGPLSEAHYLAALQQSKDIAQDAINSAINEHQLDALIAPSNGPAWVIDHANGDNFHIGSSSLAAVAGYPNITVPAGFASGLPIGVSFMGTAWNEKQLIEIAHAFEQTSGARKPPGL